ncbi:DUF721 domain-containing protein [Psychroflexus sp. ALD_RP9]|uniref:DUF721 domain-containing protein n=1 Tax=Psychroflexus sp. ALD_RP9 TaxID=2777186 RepID=UPI001A8D0B18|nr:DUF721 domain-containing protein [Psychroflexus sp. ALD_RP9]QSS97465.1 DUF721 domain-containing protein [Psychroflexus sp. ALD_RP9]
MKYNDKKRSREEQSMKDLLGAFKKNLKLEKGLNKVEVEELWFKELGSGIKTYTEKVTFTNGKLIVKLSSSTLREELSYGKSKLVARLNEQLQQPLIEQIILR